MVVSSCCVHIPKREFQNGERGGLTNWLSSQRNRFDRYLIDVWDWHCRCFFFKRTIDDPFKLRMAQTKQSCRGDVVFYVPQSHMRHMCHCVGWQRVFWNMKLSVWTMFEGTGFSVTLGRTWSHTMPQLARVLKHSNGRRCMFEGGWVVVSSQFEVGRVLHIRVVHRKEGWMAMP